MAKKEWECYICGFYEEPILSQDWIYQQGWEERLPLKQLPKVHHEVPYEKPFAMTYSLATEFIGVTVFLTFFSSNGPKMIATVWGEVPLPIILCGQN